MMLLFSTAPFSSCIVVSASPIDTVLAPAALARVGIMKGCRLGSNMQRRFWFRALWPPPTTPHGSCKGHAYLMSLVVHQTEEKKSADYNTWHGDGIRNLVEVICACSQRKEEITGIINHPRTDPHRLRIRPTFGLPRQ